MRKSKIFLIIGVVGISVLGFFLCKNSLSIKYPNDPPFKKEGTLSFYSKVANDKLKMVDIEIAETPNERSLGLMHRHYMHKNNGMLFIYKTSKKRSFWMKNTHVPLDIMYIDKGFHIVSIQKNTKPLDESKYPSYKKAMYVVEVNAGFCDTHAIKVGDSISYKKLQPNN